MTDPDLKDIFEKLQKLDGPQHVETLTAIIMGIMDDLPIEQRLDLIRALMVLHRKVCARSDLDEIAKAIQRHDSAESFMEWMQFNATRQEDQIRRQVERIDNLLDLIRGRQAVSSVPPRRPKQ